MSGAVRTTVSRYGTVGAAAVLAGSAIALLSVQLPPAGLLLLVAGGAAAVVASRAALPALPRAIAHLRPLRWWHLLWTILFLSGLVFRVRDIGAIEQSLVDPWALYRVTLVGVVGIGLLVRDARRDPPWFAHLFRGLIGLLALHAGVALLTTLWSVNPPWTLYKSTEYLVDVAMAAALVAAMRTGVEFRRLFNWTWLLTGALTLTVLAGLIIAPQASLDNDGGLIPIQLRGVLPAVSANGVGDLGALIATVALARLMVGRPHRRLYLIIGAGGVMLLALSQTRSAMAGFLFALTLIFMLQGRLRRGLVVALVAGPLILLAGLPAMFWAFFMRGQSSDLFLSLSGRLVWWQQGWELMRDHLWTGQGAFATGRFLVLAQLGLGVGSSIHNAFVEAFLGTGILGLLPLLAVVTGSWWVLWRARRWIPREHPERALLAEAMGAYAVLTVRAFFSSNLVWHPPLVFLAVLAYAEYLRRRFGNPWRSGR